MASTLSQALSAVQTKGETVLKQTDDAQAQAELLSAARELVSALESPVERLSRMVYAEVNAASIQHFDMPS